MVIGTVDIKNPETFFLREQEPQKKSCLPKKRSDYYPFGLTMPGRSSNSANPNDQYKFTGHERDQEAGINLDYMMARNYDPTIGRFLQIDPKHELYPGATPYHYTLNNPLRFTDPTGECILQLPCPDKQDLKNGIVKTAQQLGFGNVDLSISGNVTFGLQVSGEVERFGGFTANMGSIELFTLDSKIQISDEGLSGSGEIAGKEQGDDIVISQEASLSGGGLGGSLEHTFSLNNSSGNTYVTNQEVSATVGAGFLQVTGTDNLKKNTSKQTGSFDFGVSGAFGIGGNLDISIKLWEDDKTDN